MRRWWITTYAVTLLFQAGCIGTGPGDDDSADDDADDDDAQDDDTGDDDMSGDDDTFDLEDGFGQGLGGQEACGDLSVLAYNGGGTVAIEFSDFALLSEAWDAGTTVHESYDLSESTVHLRLKLGTGLDWLCMDSVEWEIEQIDPATAGTAEIAVTPNYPNSYDRVDLTLEDVVFTTGGDQVELGPYEFSNVAVFVN